MLINSSCRKALLINILLSECLLCMLWFLKFTVDLDKWLGWNVSLGNSIWKWFWNTHNALSQWEINSHSRVLPTPVVYDTFPPEIYQWASVYALFWWGATAALRLLRPLFLIEEAEPLISWITKPHSRSLLWSCIICSRKLPLTHAKLCMYFYLNLTAETFMVELLKTVWSGDDASCVIYNFF